MRTIGNSITQNTHGIAGNIHRNRNGSSNLNIAQNVTNNPAQQTATIVRTTLARTLVGVLVHRRNNSGVRGMRTIGNSITQNTHGIAGNIHRNRNGSSNLNIAQNVTNNPAQKAPVCIGDGLGNCALGKPTHCC
ncbi:hypothetical protein CVS27_06825 [Arthrobacter glacialis]|uniref:Uncharacterized protein n=1 Tax=Arthrobacter glacialis TaxID=1664 RepID=A0A2S3ZYH1_ARTGL|nr:hypothetical protein CVS27_06825 [Arthrobacter glacialis]